MYRKKETYSQTTVEGYSLRIDLAEDFSELYNNIKQD